ncbi:hypothetical protein BSKO_00850 [Bryopsis sp. KO-2023]|nr:hypothetical protein BSKO_00850 [Bryopsis sp. KO-2023]
MSARSLPIQTSLPTLRTPICFLRHPPTRQRVPSQLWTSGRKRWMQDVLVKAAVKSVDEAGAEVDTLLAVDSAESESSVVALLRSLAEEGVLLGFDGASQVPKRDYSLAELKLNNVDTTKLLAPEENTITSTRTALQVALTAGIVSLVVAGGVNVNEALGFVVVLLFFAGADQIVYRGGIEFLLLDSLTRLLRPSYGQKVAWHEAGHFLIAYFVGLLPKDYTLSAMDAIKRYRAFTVQAGTVFCDREFQQEVGSGKLKSTSVDRVTCVAVAGVVAEYLKFGFAEGGLNDLGQLDQLMRSLQFSQKKVDSQIRWSVINVATLLRRHAKTHEALAAEMSNGASVGSCIKLIESQLQTAEFV